LRREDFAAPSGMRQNAEEADEMKCRTGLSLRALGLAVAIFSVIAQPAYAKRIALVVGNSAYQHVERLVNPVSDAAAIGGTLRAIGFDSVEVIHDVTRSSLLTALRAFAIAAADSEIAVVYFAGHGIEVSGTNYLIPIDAKLAADVDVQDEAISLDRVLASLEGAKRLRLVLLDACRNNPFVAAMRRVSSTRSIGRGLARVEPEATDTLVAFAAKAGSTALDGTAGNSPFARAIINNLTEPGLDVRIALGRVRDAVLQETSRQQEPFVYGSLGGSIIALVPANGSTQTQKDVAAPVSAPPKARSEPEEVRESARRDGEALASEARSFVARLHGIMAEPNATVLKFVNTAYAEPANLYGKLTLPAVALSEKRRFLERWPIRRYVQRSGGTKVICEQSSATCRVTGIVDYDVSDPERGANSAGSSTFDYLVRVSQGRVVILREDGQVVGRRLPAIERGSISAVGRAPLLGQLISQGGLSYSRSFDE
jgi:caspase domain-containing protein